MLMFIIWGLWVLAIMMVILLALKVLIGVGTFIKNVFNLFKHN